FRDYTQAVTAAKPSVNVGALVGHTALRSNHMENLQNPATANEIAAMKIQLREALNEGALGLSRSEERRVGNECKRSVCSKQAKDGIRDFHVTGVQTCALPIFSRLHASGYGGQTER